MTAHGIQLRKYVNDFIKELFRKTIHILSAFLPLLLSYAKIPVLIALGCVLVFYVISEMLRMKGINIPIISDVTQVAARTRDANHFVLGPVTLASGILLTAIFFDPMPTKIAIYSLAFGDGLASLSGKMFGHISIPFTKGKTVVGSLTCFVAIFIAVFCVTRDCGNALLIAFVGMLIEVLPLKDFDNLLIPIILASISQYILKL